MATLIKKINEATHIEYDSGSFDNWCVFLNRGGKRYPPVDSEYFAILKILALKHGNTKLYNDFVTIYNATTKVIEPAVLELINSLSQKYGSDALELNIWLTVIYAGMVAEENKAFTRLGKRVKRLGLHQVLMEALDPQYAANFSKGKKWRDLDAIMKPKGF